MVLTSSFMLINATENYEQVEKMLLYRLHCAMPWLCWIIVMSYLMHDWYVVNTITSVYPMELLVICV